MAYFAPNAHVTATNNLTGANCRYLSYICKPGLKFTRQVNLPAVTFQNTTKALLTSQKYTLSRRKKTLTQHVLALTSAIQQSCENSYVLLLITLFITYVQHWKQLSLDAVRQVLTGLSVRVQVSSVQSEQSCLEQPPYVSCKMPSSHASREVY